MPRIEFFRFAHPRAAAPTFEEFLCNEMLMMTTQFKQLTDFFRSVGADDVPHTEKSYLAHAIGVYSNLKEWNCDEDVCQAGLFHSIYGTERFQKFALPFERRSDLQALVGKRAERLAYLNCVMDRESFDRNVALSHGPHELIDRRTGEPLPITDKEFDDLCTIHLCDWLEQVARANHWDYRREAYKRLAERLGGIALESYRRVFASEPNATSE